MQPTRAKNAEAKFPEQSAPPSGPRLTGVGPVTAHSHSSQSGEDCGERLSRGGPCNTSCKQRKHRIDQTCAMTHTFKINYSDWQHAAANCKAHFRLFLIN